MNVVKNFVQIIFVIVEAGELFHNEKMTLFTTHLCYVCPFGWVSGSGSRLGLYSSGPLLVQGSLFLPNLEHIPAFFF